MLSFPVTDDVCGLTIILVVLSSCFSAVEVLPQLLILDIEANHINGHVKNEGRKDLRNTEKNIPIKEKGVKKNYKIIFAFSLHLTSSIIHYSPCVQHYSSQSNCTVAINEILDCLYKQNIY